MNTKLSIPHDSEEPAQASSAAADFLNRPEFSLPMKIKRTRRTLYLFILLTFLIVAGVGFLGVRYKTSTTSSKAPSPVSASKSSQPTVPPLQYLDIKEWGVKVPLSAPIRDLYYVDAGSGNDADGLPSTFALGLTSLNSACGIAVPGSWNVMQHALAD